MCILIVQCNSNYVAVRSLQINIIGDVSCGERNHNSCWYLHLYSVNIKSKHRWYPNISFGMLHCSIILLLLSLSLHSPTQRKNMPTSLLRGDNDSKYNISRFRRANWNFIYGLSGELGQSAWKISQILWPFLPCLHYKKIIRNIVINLIIKNQNIFPYIYQEIKLTRQLFHRMNILLLKNLY